jgi:hypothetical protein
MRNAQGILVLDPYDCYRLPFVTNSRPFDVRAEAVCSLLNRTSGGMIMAVNAVRSALTAVTKAKHMS